MAYQAFTGRESLGKINIERFRDSIRLRWSVSGRRYSLTIGRDCQDTLKVARAKAQIISSDLVFDRFDPSLEKYGRQKSPLHVVSEPTSAPLGLRELWDKFLLDKLPHLKAKTQDEYINLTRLLEKLEAIGPETLSYNALQTKHNLLALTTSDQTRRMLQYLSACCNWGLKHRLIRDNPFLGLASDMPKRRSLIDPNPNAFSDEERDAAIAAFRNDKRPGITYQHYAPIVEFWFFTGCRPSEAIGLTWGCVSEDCSSVTFSSSIQTIKGVQVRSLGSKNNRVRSLAVSNRIKALLLSVKPENTQPESLVFPAPKGGAINYPNFLSKIWHQIVDPIKPDTTPYNCRDTFITSQLLKGVPSVVVAKWCDTSTQMIDRNYADQLKLNQLRPID